MPRGHYDRKKKTAKVETEEKVGLVSADGFTDEEKGVKDGVLPEPVRKEETKAKAEKVGKCKPPHLDQCQCQDSLSPGQAYFEDGETGTIRIGEDHKGEIWFRDANGGRGGWINRRR